MSIDKPTPVYRFSEEDDSTDPEVQHTAWQQAEAESRQMVVDGLPYKPAFLKKAVSRATDRYRLGSDFRPDGVEEMSDLMYALETRHIEEMDRFEPGSKEHTTLLAELSAYVDAVRGVDYQTLDDMYNEAVPEVRKKGAHVGWLAAINRTALLIREDLGLEKPDNSRPASRRVRAIEGEQNAANTLRATLADIEIQGKITLETKKALEYQFGLRKSRKATIDLAVETSLRQLGEEIELRKETLRTTKRLTRKIQYSGLLELLTGNRMRQPGELDSLLRNRSLQIKAAQENTEPSEIVYAMLDSDLRWLTDVTVRRDTPISSLEYRKRNGLA